MFLEIRRKDRVLDNKSAEQLLEEGEYGFLAMIGVNDYGYGIPINYVKDGDSIYFHCAQEGYKLDCLRKNPNVSFTVVGQTKVVPKLFTTAYESTIAFGKISMDLSDEERRFALRLLAKKYSPQFEEIGDRYIEKSFHRTNVLRLDIIHTTGKCKRLESF